MIFSRYAVCALIIGVEITLFISILFIASEFFAALFSVSAIISLFALDEHKVQRYADTVECYIKGLLLE